MEAGSIDRREAAAGWLRKHFDAEAARGFRCVVTLDLLGAGGGPLSLHIEDGALRVESEKPARADVVVRLDAGDFLDVLAGRANGELLHMQGRVRIEGEPSRVLKLQALFRRRV